MMSRKSVGLLGLAACLWSLTCPHEGHAEWYADIYTGAVYTRSTDLTVNSSLGTTITYQNLKVNNSWTAGGRVGYWLDQMDWLGFGLDAFYFNLKTPPGQMVGVSGSGTTSSQNADWSLPAYGIGFDVLRLRLPLLRSEHFSHGRVQPFVSAGPALFITHASQNRYVQPEGQGSTNVAVGAKVDAGTTLLLTQHIGLFAQYRFTHFTSKLEYQNNTPSPATETFRSTYDSHHFIAGLTLHF